MDIFREIYRKQPMSIWSKALYAGLGAAAGASVVYYLTQKDSEDFQERLDALNERTKEGCDAVRDWFAADHQATSSEKTYSET